MKPDQTSSRYIIFVSTNSVPWRLWGKISGNKQGYGPDLGAVSKLESIQSGHASGSSLGA